MAYTYEKQLWKDYPDTTTPITADRLNHMEDGIYEAAKSGGGDTIPVGSEFDYDGTTVPEGFVQVEDPNTYSSEEVVIGTWIDGKPIYRKVINSTVENIQTLLGNFNAKTFIDFELKAKTKDNIDFIIPSSYTSDNNYNIDLYFNSVGLPIIKFGNNYETSGIVYGFVIYTKTTD